MTVSVVCMWPEVVVESIKVGNLLKDSRPSWSNASISRRNVVNKIATVITVQLRQNKVDMYQKVIQTKPT